MVKNSQTQPDLPLRMQIFLKLRWHPDEKGGTNFECGAAFFGNFKST